MNDFLPQAESPNEEPSESSTEPSLETRDVFDKNGNKIGEMTLPVDTPESVWSYHLRGYTFSSPVKTAEEIVAEKIQQAINFGNKIVIEFATGNVLLGITQSGKTGQVADYLAGVLRYVQSGSLHEVIAEIDRLKAVGLPEDLAPFVTEERLDTFKSKFVEFLS